MSLLNKIRCAKDTRIVVKYKKRKDRKIYSSSISGTIGKFLSPLTAKRKILGLERLQDKTVTSITIKYLPKKQEKNNGRKG